MASLTGLEEWVRMFQYVDHSLVQTRQDVAVRSNFVRPDFVQAQEQGFHQTSCPWIADRSVFDIRARDILAPGPKRNSPGLNEIGSY